MDLGRVSSRAGAAVCITLACTTGCSGPEPAPLDPALLLAELRDPQAAAPAAAGVVPDDGLSEEEATAVALAQNPTVRAARAALEVARAEVAAAAVLEDPELSADLADLGVTRARLDDEGRTDGVDLSSGPLDWIAGLDLTLPLPAPGERAARVGIAQAELRGARAEVLAAEWRLRAQVAAAYQDAVLIEERLGMVEALAALTGRTHALVAESRTAGAATALEENLAALEREQVLLRREALLVERERAREHVNDLMGLPPEVAWSLQPDGAPSGGAEPAADPEALVDAAVRRRPDLAVVLARHRAAEQALALELARRWPRLVVGTALSLSLPVFSRFNARAIEVARRRREQARADALAAVHRIRAEVHAALHELGRVSRQETFFRARIGPRVRRSLELTDAAFEAREVNLLQVLTAQRQVLDARERELELRATSTAAALELGRVAATAMPEHAVVLDVEVEP